MSKTKHVTQNNLDGHICQNSCEPPSNRLFRPCGIWQQDINCKSFNSPKFQCDDRLVVPQQLTDAQFEFHLGKLAVGFILPTEHPGGIASPGKC